MYESSFDKNHNSTDTVVISLLFENTENLLHFTFFNIQLHKITQIRSYTELFQIIVKKFAFSEKNSNKNIDNQHSLKYDINQKQCNEKRRGGYG